MKSFFCATLLLLAAVGIVVGQDEGTISPDTLIPARQVTVPARMDGLFYERTYSGDSVSKFNDKYIIKVWVKRAGTTIAFDTSFVIIQPKTRGLDTLNNRRGYIWRHRFELLPR